MDLAEKKAWVILSAFKGIGPVRFKLLLDYFGTAQKALRASAKTLKDIGLGEERVNRFLSFRKNFNIDSYFFRLKTKGIFVLCAEEENYPKLLKEIGDKPPVLYLKIKKREALDQIFKQKALAVVGTRKVTSYGRQVTQMLTKGLVESGFVIVSGLARGVDRVVHETTINNSGLTIAVLGCGLDMVYPPEHKDLAARIVESGGALVSEFPLETPVAPGNFPARNRIISGLSSGVVVTEAAQKSGSLITASLAAEQGREVFAVPGTIFSPLSVGTAFLIKKGAKPVSVLADILEELAKRKGVLVFGSIISKLKSLKRNKRQTPGCNYRSFSETILRA